VCGKKLGVSEINSELSAILAVFLTMSANEIRWPDLLWTLFNLNVAKKEMRATNML
jgi:hypothetical protein